MPHKIRPAGGPLNATIRPPGSKSITNRALVCAALAQGDSVLRGALDSDDTRVMIDSLERIGIEVDSGQDGTILTVKGCGGKVPVPAADLFVGNSGTTIRFLTAALALAGGRYSLDGIPRMRERPIGDLIEALKAIGVVIDSESEGGCPPVRIDSTRSPGGTIRVRGNVSSQYLSGLLMAAPLASGPVTIEVEGALVSRPYVEMTIAVMNSFGVRVETASEEELSGTTSQNDDPNARVTERFHVAGGQNYAACAFEIEPDASAASYFWAAAAICGGTVTVRGLNQNSLQGDVAFVKCLEQAGCKVQWHAQTGCVDDEFDSESAATSRTITAISVTGPATRAIEVDMSDISDTAQTLAAVAMFLPGRTTITGIGHNRVKETDRIGNLAIELRKLGASVEEFADGISIEASGTRAAEVETYYDHRMAMSLALVGLRQPGVQILGPDCVSKTYPRFFEDLETITALAE